MGYFVLLKRLNQRKFSSCSVRLLVFWATKIASMLWYRFVFLFYFILLFSTLCSTIALKWLLMFSLFACPLLFVCLFFFATPLPKLSKTNCELCRSSPGNFYCAGPRRPISRGRDWPVLPTRLANQNTGLAWYYPRVLPADSQCR